MGKHDRRQFNAGESYKPKAQRFTREEAAARKARKMSSDNEFQRRILEGLSRMTVGMPQVPFGIDWGSVPVTPRNREQELEQQLRAAKSGIEKLDAFLNKIKAAPHAIATVASVTEGGKGIIYMGATPLEVNLPDGAAVGDQVRVVTETSQPDGKLAAPATFGAVVTVDRVIDCDVYFNMGDQQRSAVISSSIGGSIEGGDRVRLDPSGTVALQNLGRDQARFTVSAARAITWDEIGGLEEAKEALREAVEYPTKYAETYRAYTGRRRRRAFFSTGRLAAVKLC